MGFLFAESVGIEPPDSSPVRLISSQDVHQCTPPSIYCGKQCSRNILFLWSKRFSKPLQAPACFTFLLWSRKESNLLAYDLQSLPTAPVSSPCTLDGIRTHMIQILSLTRYAVYVTSAFSEQGGSRTHKFQGLNLLPLNRSATCPKQKAPK